MKARMQRSYRLVFGKSWWQHLLFWGVLFFLLLGIFSSGSSNWFLEINLIYTAIFLFPLAALTYMNLYVLISHLFRKEHYLAYALSLPFLVALGAGILYMLFERWIDHILPSYYFISYYSYWELLLFSGGVLILSTLLKLSRSWFLLLRMEQAQASQQLHTLQGQINPHFLLNSLQTIYALSLKSHEKTPEVILKLSDILKYTLYETEQAHIPLEDELNLVRDYVDMYRYRVDGDRIQILLTMDGDPGKLRIAPMLLIPFIENCFKHGLGPGKEAQSIHILVHIKGNEISLSTENPEKTRTHTPSAGLEGGGIGIRNTRRRLDILYPERHKLDISQNEGIFRVKLQLKLDS